MFEWLTPYKRPPVLAYVDAAGWPVAMRAQATVGPTSIALDSDVEAVEGAPACLTYHRLIGNYSGNDTFLIRGHFDGAGRLVPEKVVGFAGTNDDRGLGSLKFMRVLLGFRKVLVRQLAKEGCPLPVVRSSPRA